MVVAKEEGCSHVDNRIGLILKLRGHTQVGARCTRFNSDYLSYLAWRCGLPRIWLVFLLDLIRVLRVAATSTSQGSMYDQLDIQSIWYTMCESNRDLELQYSSCLIESLHPPNLDDPRAIATDKAAAEG